MSIVYIIVEGQTEEEFVNNTISPYLKGFGISNTIPILIETSPGHYGGDVSYARFKTNIQNLLADHQNFIVTSLIDYYQLRSDFPDYINGIAIPDKNQSVLHLENQITLDIPDRRFIPYIQLHEFEGLLFVDITGFDYIPNLRPASRTAIESIIASFPNPEMLNDGPTSAPSKRLTSLIYKYKKPFHGPIIALENGITPILAKCPRFNNWINAIVARIASL